jgi:hypothetical protein
MVTIKINFTRRHRMDQQLLRKLETLEARDVLIFPLSRSSPRIDVGRTVVGTELGWIVTMDGKAPFISRNAEKVVEYLLTLRPVNELTQSTIVRVDQVDMRDG